MVLRRLKWLSGILWIVILLEVSVSVYMLYQAITGAPSYSTLPYEGIRIAIGLATGLTAYGIHLLLHLINEPQVPKQSYEPFRNFDD